MNSEQKAIIDAIQDSAEALQGIVQTVPAELMDKRPQPGEWSVKETLIHIRNVVMLVYGLRLRRLLCEEEPTFADYEEEQHLLSLSRPQLPVAEIVEMIVTDHRQTARLLSTLADEDWQRQGHHPRHGPMSIQFLARRFAEHAKEHLGQINETVEAVR